MEKVKRERERDRWTPLRFNYPNSEKVNKVSMYAETLFTRLIAQSDDGANFEGRPARLMCRLMDIRFEDGLVDVAMVERLRDELVDAELVCLYKFNGWTGLHINDGKKQLRPDIKLDIRFPGYSDELVVAGVPDPGPSTLRGRVASVSKSGPTSTSTSTSTKGSRPCLIDKKEGRVYSKNRKGNPVWLCQLCYLAWKKTEGDKRWGFIAPAKVEKIILKNKALRDKE